MGKFYRGPFTRTNYFSGRLLTAADFQREQDYHRQKRWLLNRLVIGYGVVAGLEVVADKNFPRIVIKPGLAIDNWGREIVVPKPVTIKLPSKYIPKKGKKPKRPIRAALVLSYKERRQGAIPVVGQGNNITEAAYLLDGFKLTFGDGIAGKKLPMKRPSKRAITRAMLEKLVNSHGEWGNQGDPGITLVQLYVPELPLGKKSTVRVDSSLRPLILTPALCQHLCCWS